jgi:maltooligosyltrehalose trehalohydrolase
MNIEVWAPYADTVSVRIADPGRIDRPEARTTVLEPGRDGWFSAEVPEARPGLDYGFLLDDRPALLADPRSRWQPQGVYGPSRFTDGRFPWTDGSWSGRGLAGAVFYELHVGTFTREGTLFSAVERLDHLVELGVTHVELLPVNAFDGLWNWGYDGVLWYAVHEPYGGPVGLKHFVDACHARGLAVALDVVYNHLGPSGNVLPLFGPYVKEGRSSWGDLINLDGDGSGPVRQLIVDNALMWLSEFHVDALRLDAVHALHDSSHPHILAELSEQVDELSERLGRPLVLVAESDLNDPAMVTPRSGGGYGLDAQWDDDVHHALHALLTGERQGYYVDFGSLDVLATVLTRAFLHAGTYSTFRGRIHGRPVDRRLTPGSRFVACLQNHDQVGNRAAGERLSELVSTGLAKVGAVLLLMSPFTPLLWMGEEWGASTRWPFFTSHLDPEVAEATTRGRLEEFAAHGWDPAQVPDPQDPATFLSARLDWGEPVRPGHAEILDLYRRLIRLRRDAPELADTRLDHLRVEVDESSDLIVIHRGSLRVMANVGRNPQVVPIVGAELLVLTDPGCRAVEGGLLLPGESAAVARTPRPPTPVVRSGATDV